MRDIFSAIFLVSLACLFGFHFFNLFYLPIQSLVLPLFFLSLLSYWLKRTKVAYFFIIFAFAFLLSSTFLRQKEEFYRLRNSPIPQTDYISIEGQLREYPEVRHGESILFLRSRHISYEKKTINFECNIRIRVQGQVSGLNKGDIIQIAVRVSPGHFSQNFFRNPLEDVVLANKTHFSGFCKSPKLIMIRASGNLCWRLIGKLREGIRTAIEERYLNGEGRLDVKGAFLQAVLLGDRGRIKTVDRENLLSAGIYHLLAISGAHIGILALCILFILKLLRVSRIGRFIICGNCLVLYLFLSGMRISAQRAVLMAIIIFVGKILYGQINPFNIISFCGLILLIKNPAAFLDAGFILTFTLTAAIIQGRSLFLRFIKWMPANLAEILSANFSAALISIPLSLYYFKRYSFASFFSGLLIFPLIALIVGLAFLMVPISMISIPAGNLLLILLDIPLTLFFKVSGIFSNFLNLNIFNASPSFWIVIMILILYFRLGDKSISIRRKMCALGLLIGLLVYICLRINNHEPENLEVYYLDVGHGDCQVAVLPGGDAMLIDGGGTYFSDYQIGRQVVLPFLLQKKIRVKWVAVSHFHPDHVKGICEIINIIKPEELWLSHEAYGNKFFDFFKRDLNPAIIIKWVHSGYTLQINRVRIEILSPNQIIRSKHIHNNHSQVLLISDSCHRFLFTGDIETAQEQFLVSQKGWSLAADVIKVPHHGSGTSSTLPFLGCVKPIVAVFSMAMGNRFNFPHPRVIKNFKRIGSRILSTSKRGGIKIISFPSRFEIETSR